MDQFKGDYDKAMEALGRIKTENQKRKNAEAAGESTVKVKFKLINCEQFDTLLRGQLEQLNIQIQGLERVIIQSETSGLLMKDKEKRKAQVNELRSQYNFIRDGILEVINQPKAHNTVYFNKI